MSAAIAASKSQSKNQYKDTSSQTVEFTSKFSLIDRLLF